MTGTFTARYRSVCEDCEESIEPGQEIRSLGDGQYEHITCRENAERPVTICTSCWLAQPCGCEDD